LEALGPSNLATYQTRRQVQPRTIHCRTNGSLQFSEAWLHEQYLRRARSTLDIASELGISAETVTRNLQRCGFPVRPAGVHSRTEMLAAADKSLPADIRRAVEGTLHGWQRLQRFHTAMAFPTIEAAASHLGAHQAALVRQFQQLEHDIGTRLFDRSTPTTPMRPTRRGKALHQVDAGQVARRRSWGSGA
jgi:hypothetical protein